jgi:hypothetical protein
MTDLPPPPPKGAIPPQTPPRPRSPRIWPWIAGIVGVIGVIGVIVLIVIGAQRTNNQESPTPDRGTETSSSVVVTYVVSGNSGQADVTYQNRDGNTSQESGVSLPWQYGYATTSGAYFHISAQRGRAAGDITCSIEIDGHILQTSSSTGPNAICTASGTVWSEVPVG